jgi:hypothetical protein
MMKCKKLRRCSGCEDNFYNGNNNLGIQECWMLKQAKLVTRFKIGTWTQPTEPYAFSEVRVLNCFHQKGAHFFEKLPAFVDKSKVGGRK